MATRSAIRVLYALAFVVICVSAGCASVVKEKAAQVLPLPQPSNDRNWNPNLAKLSTAEFNPDDTITVRNVRNTHYISEDEYIVRHDDKTYDLKDLETAWFFVVPFQEMPMLAHTMLSFGFGDGEFVAVSVEVRLEDGEVYSPFRGAGGNFEIMYVVADERDLIRLRTEHREADVYLYQARATPEQNRRLFIDVMTRVNELAEKPEFYDTLTNNCTTNIVKHVNALKPGRIPYGVGVLLPGLSDRLAYNLGLLETNDPFDVARSRAYVNWRALKHREADDFSLKIREEE
ncbi:MAG: DUF4105 domain-containing protein [bacterium]|nr:DUF4105 domain-containing protein [bacterium]